MEAETVFTEAGFKVTAIRPVEPALEDIFISVLTEH
jgi:hypothetical protein